MQTRAGAEAEARRLMEIAHTTGTLELRAEVPTLRVFVEDTFKPLYRTTRAFVFTYSVGAGRFDDRNSRGRLLMRDQYDFRDFRICHPAGWRRQATRSYPALGNWWETGSAACDAFRVSQPLPLDEAIQALRRDPTHPVLVKVDDALTVEVPAVEAPAPAKKTLGDLLAHDPGPALA